MLLIRIVLGTVLVLMLLPADRSAPDTSRVDVGSAFMAAGAAIADMRGFCDRQPGACEVGAEALRMAGERAMQNAKALHGLIVEGDEVEEGTKPAPTATARPASQHTLRPSDLAPTWRGAAERPA
jgi:hypothetical protein